MVFIPEILSDWHSEIRSSIFAGCHDTARPTSGNVILMNTGAISWYSGRQTTTALCTAMAETIALAKVLVKGCCEVFKSYSV